MEDILQFNNRTEPPQSPELRSREEVITYLDKTHGIEYDAGEVVYLKDGCTAEELTDENEWRIYRNEDSDECIETVGIALQSPESPQTVECTTGSPEARETARKRANRIIGSTQITRCNALRRTTNVSRCPTANHFAGDGKMGYVSPGCSPRTDIRRLEAIV